MTENEQEDRSQSRDDDQDSFPPISSADLTEAIGTQIGPYKILSVLGEGGFGIVYLTEQKKPVRRQIALKVIKPGMDSKQVIARFEAEQQALALLDHPNIARVFDAGTAENGRLYFAMEYVKGISITEDCDHHKFTVEERLKLFLQVCEAIQHAHQKGIIHRDVKPSNILVSVQDGKAVPKIIDFGVAKALSQPLTERTLFTEQGQLIGTPEYMSPEQAEMFAQDVDTRTDIYSLGVVLYELLAGALPFDPETLRRAAFSEIQRVIQQEDPPRPSTRLLSLNEEAEKVAVSRRTEVASLAKRLRKELEWIPLKAMRKEPSHRYRSVSELLDDIQNYLNGVPLIAGPESVTYRAGKFVRKHTGPLISIALIVVLLAAALAGLVASLHFRNLALVREMHSMEMAIWRLDPSYGNDLAWSYATSPVDEYRNGPMAVKLATNACVLTKWSKAEFVDTLAAAFAEIGDFESAVKWETKAIDLLTNDHRATHESDYTDRLKLYQSSKPYRETRPAE